ncbi:MAG: hypothetical protein LBJ84_05835 [Oscillospiraceae bacterium]|jgi:hypothetical protein|nr:hypothetical protein [Oscillospiraceae bacterium]
MAAVALIDLNGGFQDGKVRLNWRYPPSAPESVHIYPVRRRGGMAELVMGGHISRYLRDCPSGISFAYDDAAGGGDVKKRDFCVYLSGHNDLSPDMEALMSNGEFIVTISIGQAGVVYDIRSKTVEDGLMCHSIRLQSSAVIDEGVLGYSFDFFGVEMTAPFPGRVPQGKIEYPPIYLPTQAGLSIVLASGRNADISVAPGSVSMGMSKLFKSSKRK